MSHFCIVISNKSNLMTQILSLHHYRRRVLNFNCYKGSKFLEFMFTELLLFRESLWLFNSWLEYNGDNFKVPYKYGKIWTIILNLFCYLITINVYTKIKWKYKLVHTLSEPRIFTTHTSPKAPLPITLMISKSSLVNLKDLIHDATGLTKK